MEDQECMRLIVAPQARALLEKRRLTDEDVRKTIVHAGRSGRKFVHPQSGHFLAGVRPYFVTVWVGYAPREEGFEAFSAYQHRVEITAERPS